MDISGDAGGKQPGWMSPLGFAGLSEGGGVCGWERMKEQGVVVSFHKAASIRDVVFPIQSARLPPGARWWKMAPAALPAPLTQRPLWHLAPILYPSQQPAPLSQIQSPCPHIAQSNARPPPAAPSPAPAPAITRTAARLSELLTREEVPPDSSVTDGAVVEEEEETNGRKIMKRWKKLVYFGFSCVCALCLTFKVNLQQISLFSM